MPVILNEQPIPDRDSVTFVGTEQVRLRADQIIVWVSLHARHLTRLPRFPAILDSGFTHFFALQERHLIEWAQATGLSVLGAVREEGMRSPLYDAHLRIHCNIPGTTEPDPDREPFLLDLPRGIVVQPTAGRFPRLPLVGLRTLIHNRLRWSVAGDRRRVNLRTPRRWWPFG